MPKCYWWNPLQPVTITWSGTPSFPNWVAHEFGSVATSRFCRKIPRFHDFAEKPVVDCEALSPKNSQKMLAKRRLFFLGAPLPALLRFLIVPLIQIRVSR